ncbi:MAG TPA: hypothetical protein VEI48_02745 [Candidatus Sulfotelmatobacter sp.]|nr:hypothetical protein [Candidatus Sulfotelmatobacter sp.]
MLSSDGQSAGTVTEVLGSRDEDIFHGLIVHVSGQQRVLTSDCVASISAAGVVTDHTAAELVALPVYTPEATFHAELTKGHFGRFVHEHFTADDDRR